MCFFFNKNLAASLNDLFSGSLATPSISGIVLYLAIIFIVATTVSGHFIKLLLSVFPNHLPLFEGKYRLNHIHPNPMLPTSENKSSISEEFSYVVTRHQDLSRGKIIGYLERLLVIVLIVHNAFSGIAFIVAAKAIARFKQMDDRDFAEYFLLGTLCSILLGIIFGLITKHVLSLY